VHAEALIVRPWRMPGRQEKAFWLNGVAIQANLRMCICQTLGILPGSIV
jgi:hypothetical protein